MRIDLLVAWPRASAFFFFFQAYGSNINICVVLLPHLVTFLGLLEFFYSYNVVEENSNTL